MEGAWRANKLLELTPLRVEQDRAILEPGLGTKAFPIYRRGAAQRQPVRRTFKSEREIWKRNYTMAIGSVKRSC